MVLLYTMSAVLSRGFGILFSEFGNLFLTPFLSRIGFFRFGFKIGPVLDEWFRAAGLRTVGDAGPYMFFPYLKFIAETGGETPPLPYGIPGF